MPFPEHAPYFGIFRFANSWYLVPITSLEMRRPIELQFWWLEGKAWHNRWTQQGEVVLRIYEDVDKDPYRQDNFVNVLGAVGPLLPGPDSKRGKIDTIYLPILSLLPIPYLPNRIPSSFPPSLPLRGRYCTTHSTSLGTHYLFKTPLFFPSYPLISSHIILYIPHIRHMSTHQRKICLKTTNA